ncbi:MAG: hypothetical protein CVV14_10275 [Gammaproteobacteria bacterium HGW-Gammaproteobacteria-4]|nr:MAG: hypothetical protein CVV14_10275 [Gammaproteobacteria bacterium HGW-Gammaproteobacteria-4]
MAGCAFVAQAASSTTGVAFVHGTGSQTDALNAYWKAEFVNSVRQGLVNQANFVVINCDFNQYMWDSRAAGCLAGQLTNFISPTWDSRYPNIISKTRWVNALAPSSGGTPLADAVMNGNVFESAVGWLLGFKTDAVRQQQVSWMAFYNANWLFGTAGRPATPKKFYSVVGTDVETAVWDSDSYCGGYTENLGLEVTQFWLDSCSDGFLNCSSQSAAGSVWFNDKSRMAGGEPLSHNQSRRACFGLDTILRNDL